MARYQQFLYNTDTYGQRVRGDIALDVVPTGYRRDEVSGRLVSRFRLTVGPLPSFPDGSKIIILASSVYFPSVPERLSLPLDALFDRSGATSTATLLQQLAPSLVAAAYFTEERGNFSPEFSTEFDDSFVGPYLHPEVSVVSEGWVRSFSDRSLRPVPLNSILYLRAYVNEPAPEGSDITLPWDVRGQAFCVMPGNYGGIRGAISALPVALLTDGSPFDALPYEQALVGTADATTNYVSSLGYLSDVINTTGSLMVDHVDRLHPNMVFPLLRAFGMTDYERAALSDRLISDRAKKLLKTYRALQMARGRSQGVCEYLRTVTGFGCEITSSENLLLTLGDSAPAGPVRQDWTGAIEGTAIAVRGATYGSIPTPQGAGCLCPRQGWLGTWFDPGFIDYWSDSWDGDLWLNYWGEWDNLTGESGTPEQPTLGFEQDLVQLSGDTWRSEDSYSQYLEWAHRVKPAAGGGWIGTAVTAEGELDWMRCEPLGSFENGVWIAQWSDDWTAHYFRLRCRARKIGTAASTIIPIIYFLDQDGQVVSTHTGSTVVLTDAFQNVETIVQAPEGAGYVAWRFELPGVVGEDNAVVSIGAIELRDMGARTGPYIEVEDAPYRNPRSLVLALHTPYVPADDTVVVVDDPVATVDDRDFQMSQKSVSGRGQVDTFTGVMVAKSRALITDYLPHSVTARVVAGNDAEYGRLFGTDRPAGSVIAAPSEGYLGDFWLE